MPTLAKLTKYFTSWSFSRLQDWRKCPFFAACKHLRKIKEPGNDAMARGSAIDTLAKQWASSAPAVKAIPAELKLFRKEFTEVRKHKDMQADPDWSFTRSWGQTTWNNWAECWLRVKVDLTYLTNQLRRLVVIDYKTGQIKESHDEQLKLYAPAGMLIHPTVEEVETKLWYLDHGVETVKIYKKSELKGLIAYWEQETKPMLADRRFSTRPGDYCRWCFYRKSNGGPCKY